ncbi:MAG: response regulator [Acetobacteraceae bacterium]|nr:response regulator [Acetobacteraceae bacterium]
MTDDPAAPPSPTVLVVEDEALVAMLVADTLAGAGYRPTWCPDGASAHGRGADAVAAVVDLRLADGADGREVVRGLRRRRPGLPVVVVTGFHPEAPQADLRGLGGPTLRLCKPFDCDDLADGVSAVLGAPAVPAAVPAIAPRRRRSDRSVVPA